MMLLLQITQMNASMSLLFEKRFLRLLPVSGISRGKVKKTKVKRQLKEQNMGR